MNARVPGKKCVTKCHPGEGLAGAGGQGRHHQAPPLLVEAVRLASK